MTKRTRSPAPVKSTATKKSRDAKGAAVATAEEEQTVGGMKEKMGISKSKSDLTNFQRRVYAIVKRIPAGKVSTYKYVAESMGHPRSYRAVGSSLSMNPFSPAVPCHRVLASTGAIGGFFGETANCPVLRLKLTMLQQEGIEFDAKDKFILHKDAKYREQVILQKVDAKGIDQLLDDASLMKI